MLEDETAIMIVFVDCLQLQGLGQIKHETWIPLNLWDVYKEGLQNIIFFYFVKQFRILLFAIYNYEKRWTFS